MESDYAYFVSYWIYHVQLRVSAIEKGTNLRFSLVRSSYGREKKNITTCVQLIAYNVGIVLILNKQRVDMP